MLGEVTKNQIGYNNTESLLKPDGDIELSSLDVNPKNKAEANKGFNMMADGYKAAAELRTIAQEQLSKTVAAERARQLQVKEDMNTRRREIANDRLNGRSSTPDALGSILADVEDEQAGRDNLKDVVGIMNKNRQERADVFATRKAKDAELNTAGEKAFDELDQAQEAQTDREFEDEMKKREDGYRAAAELRKIAQEQLSKTVTAERARQLQEEQNGRDFLRDAVDGMNKSREIKATRKAKDAEMDAAVKQSYDELDQEHEAQTDKEFENEMKKREDAETKAKQVASEEFLDEKIRQPAAEMNELNQSGYEYIAGIVDAWKEKIEPSKETSKEAVRVEVKPTVGKSQAEKVIVQTSPAETAQLGKVLQEELEKLWGV